MLALCHLDSCLFFQAEDGIRDLVRSRGLGDVYKRQEMDCLNNAGRIGSFAGTTIYSTLMPCYMCAGTIAVSYTHLTLPTSDLV